jgi:glycosyltransferase involved in cell wall biosynthesis
MNFQGFDGIKGTEPGDFPVVLWNHRWEYDKNPEDFFQALFILAEKGKDFRLIVLGEGFSTVPPIFNHAREKLGDRIIHFGYAEDFSHYGELLHRADIIPITSKQEFFGGSLMEALYCSTIPLLPRRLTYGELVPPEEYHSYFYDTFDELVHTLEYLIINYRTIDRSPFRKGAARFSWEVLAEAYDSELAGVACLRK